MASAIFFAYVSDLLRPIYFQLIYFELYWLIQLTYNFWTIYKANCYLVEASNTNQYGTVRLSLSLIDIS